MKISFGSYGRFALLAVFLFLFAFFAVFVVLTRLQPLAEPMIAGKGKSEVFLDSPPGCPPEGNPYPKNDHREFAFFTISDELREVRGYILGTTDERWGRVESLPGAIQAALADATILVTDARTGETNWHQGYAPRSPYRLSQLAKSAGGNALTEEFQTCRLGGFWRDMHAAFALDLFGFCRAQADEWAEERDAIQSKCSLGMDLASHALNRPIPLKPIETPQERMKLFELASQDDLLSIFSQELQNGQNSSTSWAAFNLAQAEQMTQTLKAADPLKYRLLISERNYAWLPRMRQHLSADIPFFAVNTLHLPGKQGVLALLEGLGFRMKPLETS